MTRITFEPDICRIHLYRLIYWCAVDFGVICDGVSGPSSWYFTKSTPYTSRKHLRRSFWRNEFAIC